MRVLNLMLMSLDGEIASPSEGTHDERLLGGLSNAYDQKLVQEELEQNEAVIIGASSVRVDGICHTENFRGKFPTWYVLTTRGLDPSLRFWQQTHLPRILVAPTQVPSYSEQVPVLTYGTQHPGAFLVEHLHKAGIKKVLLLGGGAINRIFYSENLVDELKITIAPQIIACGRTRVVDCPLASTVKLELLQSHAKDSFIYSHYKVCRPPSATGGNNRQV